ncbi:MAG TPA: DUF3568 family protein [Methylomirabilota bacterium]|nr:DUF3568 family protein [Methylomirabilota bacterium]
MKTKIFAALAVIGISIVITGCVSTVSGTHTQAMSFGKDAVSGRYERSLDQVYAAAVQVVQNNGTMITEYIPHDSTNTVRALYGKVNQENVWVRVEAVDPKVTEVTVQARSKWGSKDLDLVHELEKEIALQLSR